MIDRLILVRHGETLHNVEGIAQGWSDSALSARGEAQVAKIAARVRSMRPTSIYASTLPRALTTAGVISKELGLPVQPLDDLREMNCGDWEGRSFLEIRAEQAEFYARWVDDPTVACPNGESFHDVWVRMQRAIDTIERNERSDRARPVIVTHATAIRITATGLLGLPLTVARSFAQENAAVNIIERRPERHILRLWNDTTHCAGV